MLIPAKKNLPHFIYLPQVVIPFAVQFVFIAQFSLSLLSVCVVWVFFFFFHSKSFQSSLFFTIAFHLLLSCSFNGSYTKLAFRFFFLEWFEIACGSVWCFHLAQTFFHSKNWLRLLICAFELLVYVLFCRHNKKQVRKTTATNNKKQTKTDDDYVAAHKRQALIQIPRDFISAAIWIGTKQCSKLIQFAKLPSAWEL